MRKLSIAALVAALSLAVVPVFADGPSGSHEEDTTPDGDTTYDNDVTCGSGEVTPLGVVYAGENGVEFCNDGAGAAPIQGRLIATTDDGGYIAADGDKDNAAEAQGWVRIDGGGVRCGDDEGNLDATHPGAEDTQDDCG